MKIANIILTSANGGAEQVFIDYSIILERLGHQVFSIVRHNAPYIWQLEKNKFSFAKVKHFFGHQDIFVAIKILKTLKKIDANLVIAHAGRAMVLSRMAVWFLNKFYKKNILHISVNHSMNVKRSIGSDFIISVNKQIFYKTIDEGQDSARSFVVHNATDIDGISANFQKINLKEKDVIVVGGLGRLDKEKAFRFLVKTASFLKKNYHKKIIVKIGGNGKRLEYLKNLANEFGVSDDVHFTGWAKDRKAFFESLDIFCLPSVKETFGLVILEAIKFHKPIISTNTDGPQEILRDGIDGIFIEKSPEAKVEERFGKAIIRIIEEENLANYLVKNSFERLTEKFSYQSLEKNLSEIIGKNYEKTN